MATVYAGEWKTLEDVKRDAPAYDLPAERHIVYAAYETGSYDGSSLIVFEKNGEWFENNDSHCSCNGLESWEPEKTTPEALLMRKDTAALGAAVATRQRLIARRKLKQ